MATQNPISTISYNTEEFLREKLDSWVDAHIIQAYQYICHVGEDGDKNHIHLRLEPNKRVDPMDLTDALREFVMGGQKPLGVRPWRPSKEEDWYLYVVHDEEYLRRKYGGGEKGEKIPYNYTAIQVSDGYDLECAFIRARATLEHTQESIADKLRKGANPLDLVMQGGNNAFVVSNLTRLLRDTDYSRLAKEYERLEVMFDTLCGKLHDVGIGVYIDENDNITLGEADLIPMKPDKEIDDMWKRIEMEDN